MNALDLIGVGHSFGKATILSGVTFSVPQGSFTGLLGANGAGKTTLISLITRLYHARQGTISVLGHPLTTEPLLALRALGAVFQQPTLDLDLTVAAHLRYHGALRGLPRRDADRRGEAELARLEVAHLTSRVARTLSGGERRRVEIARALMHEPRVLIADEPTAGLDQDTRAALVEHIRKLCRERGLAALWATHLADEVASADQVIELRAGAMLDRPSAASNGSRRTHRAEAPVP
jgi:ABC-2 type transport system ATP-binding protein